MGREEKEGRKLYFLDERRRRGGSVGEGSRFRGEGRKGDAKRRTKQRYEYGGMGRVVVVGREAAARQGVAARGSGLCTESPYQCQVIVSPRGAGEAAKGTELPSARERRLSGNTRLLQRRPFA